MIDHQETTVEEEMSEMSEGMKEIEIGTGIERGWTMAMIVVAACEHTAEVGARSESMITELGSGSHLTETETGIESVIIAISIGDDEKIYGLFKLKWTGIQSIVDSLLAMYFAWRLGHLAEEGYALVWAT